MTISNERRKLTEPLESVTAVFGALMLAALAVGAAVTVFGSSNYLGGFVHGVVCTTQPDARYSSSAWTLGPPMATARPGNSVSFYGTLQACAHHPAIGQRALYGLTQLPVALFWGCAVLLLWRLITAARRAGPFTPGIATAMRRLGWFIIAGSLAVPIVHVLALHWLLATMVKTAIPFPDLVYPAVRGLVPVPLLAGAALLTFARIIRAGAAMDEEIKGTV